MNLTRRRALAAVGASAASATLARLAQAASPPGGRAGAEQEARISTNTYPWLTFARRAQRPFQIHSDGLLAEIAATGITGYEPIIEKPSEFDGLPERLRRHGLAMPSIYVNSALHDEARAAASAETVLAIARAARPLGVETIVTNPSPIRWGGTEDKTDAQLRTQAAALDRLGAALRGIGVTLAYHNHDAELRQGGREFHHMLTATDPDNVKFCLDAHWVFRGCGDSQVALFDALAHYHLRVVELHLRQSTGGVWDEVFDLEGDIDYQRLFDTLAQRSIHPHLVLEQAVESDSPRQLTATQAHRQGRDNLAGRLE